MIKAHSLTFINKFSKLKRKKLGIRFESV